MVLNSKVYDVLKYVALILIPASIVFLNTCLPVWGVSEQIANVIITTVSAVGTLLGSLITVSSINYVNRDQEGDAEK